MSGLEPMKALNLDVKNQFKRISIVSENLVFVYPILDKNRTKVVMTFTSGELETMRILMRDKGIVKRLDALNSPSIKRTIAKFNRLRKSIEADFESQINKTKKEGVKPRNNKCKDHKANRDKQVFVPQKFSIYYSKSNILRNKDAEALFEKLNSINGVLPTQKLKINSFGKKLPLIEKFSKNPAPLFDNK